ncbi:MAG: hypothetical protein E6J91_31530 [Deltaproteobacteria bacterium]|nr:MAG: hypothetical protein E6J91_31530 [Deltaproteobacteria bacterium]
MMHQLGPARGGDQLYFAASASSAISSNVERWLRASAKIIRRTPDGATAVFAGGGFGHRDGFGSTARFGMITDIAFATDDTAYLTDGGAIRRIDRAGNVSTLFGAADASRLFGLAVDRGGSVVAADTGPRRVLRVAADGTSTVIATSEAPWSPAGVALHGRDVYILESWYDTLARSGMRVRSVAPDGTVTVLASVGAALPVPTTPTTSRSLGVLAGLTVGLLAHSGRDPAAAPPPPRAVTRARQARVTAWGRLSGQDTRQASPDADACALWIGSLLVAADPAVDPLPERLDEFVTTYLVLVWPGART